MWAGQSGRQPDNAVFQSAHHSLLRHLLLPSGGGGIQRRLAVGADQRGAVGCESVPPALGLAGRIRASSRAVSRTVDLEHASKKGTVRAMEVPPRPWAVAATPPLPGRGSNAAPA